MFNKYPYTDFHELNLDWILHKIKELNIEMKNFEVLNSVTFEGVWDITKAYTKWSIVTYNNVGYISTEIVPAGINITNTDYWTEVFDYIEFVKHQYTVINVVEYGADNTGIRDNSQIIQDLFDKYEHATFFFDNGDYLFDSGITLNHSCNVILDTKARLIANQAMSTFITLAADGSREEYSSVFGMKKICISGGIIDGKNLVDRIFNCEWTYKSHLKDLKLVNFNNTGIYIGQGGGLVIENCDLFGSDNGPRAVFGIKDDSYDNSILFTSVVNCATGFSTNDDQLIGCTAWIDNPLLYPGTVAFEDWSTTSYTECTADTVETGWKGNNISTSLLSNCSVINNNGVILPTASTYVFDKTSASPKYKYTNLTVLLQTCTFCEYPASISGINLTTAGSYANVPDLTDFNQIKLPYQFGSNLDSTVIDSHTTSENINAYFLAATLPGAPGGWGNLQVIATANVIVQIATIAGFGTQSRVSDNGGSTWSSWA